ncbi:S8 family serine peptidase [Ancylothrix sp. C2]|uniref:S8 family serine peptidase n=1 Tax=Ancylothrix sp. D3o TaxID=2953691 RepID=UPI0021BAA14B|nr:S8 family serine peptidase [Ancylothrix sp. D3o]MCT7949945.1 S8 family serine peptidase [Ancylothrix sp. D3o]
MTTPNNSPQSYSNPTPGVGVPEQSIGFILQRGGDELYLEKVPNRFTIRLVNPSDGPESWPLPAGVTHLTSFSQVHLEEYQTEPANLEKAMQAARDNEAICFVSHVYNVRNSPYTLVYLTNEITVQFNEAVKKETRDSITNAAGLRLQKPLAGIPNTFIYNVTKQATENPVKIANRLISRPDIMLAEPNVVVLTVNHYRPRDTMYPKQWYLYNAGGPGMVAGAHIDIEKAWDITRGVRSVVVAITDDSVDLRHPDFQGVGKIVAPRDFKERDFLPLPGEAEDNHGTSCAGVAVAEETGAGIVGVAPGCSLMPLRTTGYLDDTSIEDLFEWAIQKNAAVVSCSWGASAVYFPLSLRQSSALNRAATQGRDGKGCVIIFAAGNSNRPTTGTVNERGWPNNVVTGSTKWLAGFTVHPDVITVAASTSLNKKAAYSNWGPTISVCAPSNNAPPGIWLQETGYIATAPQVAMSFDGLGVFTTDRVGSVGYDSSDFTSDFGGTSSATPVVAGVAALILSVNPDLTAQQVKQILQSSADKIIDRDKDPQLGFNYGTYDANGFSQWFGYGKVNAYKAVIAAQKTVSPSWLRVSRQLQGRNDFAVVIPDGDLRGVTSAIRVNDNSPVLDLRVTVNIEHQFMGDLEVYLVAPSGKKALLQNRSLGARKSLQMSYSMQDTPALRLLANEPASGVWMLQVIDYSPEDVGTLKSWDLIIGL